MTRRPSITTSGRQEKSESSRTSCATWRAASLPEAMAMLQSASLSAKNVVDAIARHSHGMPVFLQGMHQNTLLLWLYPAENGVGFGGLGQLILRKNGDVDIPVCAGRPTWRAMLATVMGWSPEMILTCTPSLAKKARVSLASGRRVSHSTTAATGTKSSGKRCGSSGAWLWASSSTRQPLRVWYCTVRCSGWLASGSKKSGAPKYSVPRSAKQTAPHLRSEEKGRACV